VSETDREFQRQISERIEDFVADITRLAREHAYRSLAGALEVTPISPSSTKTRSGNRGGKVGRRKRGQAELTAVCQELLGVIALEPGLKMQSLAAKLGTTPKDLALPAKRLISEKKVRTEGQKRSTTYFPTAKGKKTASV